MPVAPIGVNTFGGYQAYLYTPPYPVPTPTTATTQIVQGNPNTLGTTGMVDSFAFDAVGGVLYFTTNGTTWTAYGGGSSGANFLSGNGSPVGVVTPTVIGQTYSDKANPAAVNFWVSTGLTNTSWYEVAGS
jgi:hypothetical protein